MRAYYGCIKLTLEAEFSNVLIVYITCKGSMLPDHELNVLELVRINVEFVYFADSGLQESLGLTVTAVTRNSYRIGNLLVLKVCMKVLNQLTRYYQLFFS